MPPRPWPRTRPANGSLTHVWPAGDEASRRLVAVQLVRTKAARAIEVAAAFGVEDSTLWRWHAQAGRGTAALAPGWRGPKGPSRLTDTVVADVRDRRRQGATIRQIAAAAGIAEGSVRRALSPEFDPAEADETESSPAETAVEQAPDEEAADDGPGVAAPAPRPVERGLARQELLAEAAPVFTGAARVPLAGLLQSLPALQGTGVLSCAKERSGDRNDLNSPRACPAGLKGPAADDGAGDGPVFRPVTADGFTALGRRPRPSRHDGSWRPLGGGCPVHRAVA